MLLSSSRLRYRCRARFGLVDDDGLLNRRQKSRFRGACASPGERKVFSPDGFQCSASMYMGITGGSKTFLFFFFHLTSSLLPLQVGHSLSLAHPSCSSNSSSAQEYSPDSGSRSHYSLLHPLPLLLLLLLHLLVHQ